MSRHADLDALHFSSGVSYIGLARSKRSARCRDGILKVGFGFLVVGIAGQLFIDRGLQAGFGAVYVGYGACVGLHLLFVLALREESTGEADFCPVEVEAVGNENRFRRDQRVLGDLDIVFGNLDAAAGAFEGVAAREFDLMQGDLLCGDAAFSLIDTHCDQVALFFQAFEEHGVVVGDFGDQVTLFDLRPFDHIPLGNAPFDGGINSLLALKRSGTDHLAKTGDILHPGGKDEGGKSDDENQEQTPGQQARATRAAHGRECG